MEYYEFIEDNEWEGEIWHFYIPLTNKQIIEIKKLIKGKSQYKLKENPISENEVNLRVEHSSEGYFKTHNKCKGIQKHFEKEVDPFYKGGCWINE